MNLFEKRWVTKQTYGYQGEKRGGIVWNIGIDIYRLLYLKQIKNNNMVCIQYKELYSILFNNLNGKRIWKRIDTCVCVTESLFCNTSLLINYNIKLFFKKYKKLSTIVKEDLGKWRDIPNLWVGKLDISKMAILYTLV